LIPREAVPIMVWRSNLKVIAWVFLKNGETNWFADGTVK
jgi:hypothetical protein